MRRFQACICLIVLFGFTPLAIPSLAQTASTGALAGIVTDPSGAVVPGATIRVVNTATGDAHTFLSQPNGSYLAPFLSPGAYRVEASKNGFSTVTFTGVSISVAETSTLNVKLQVGTISQSVTVTTEGQILQTQSQALGQVTDQRMIEALPLVTGNYTQILGLSPSVSTNVNNAAAIGAGDATISAHGAVTNDNNFQMNGVGVSDLENGTSIPIPNPDTIQEFKVQTGQYDASFGRNAGANVDVITKGGGNQFHGDVFEFLRNDDFNANDFFLNQAGRPRAELKQNLFGGSVGGPVIREKVFFFGSYQGVRQRNGLAAQCLGSFSTPPELTGLPDRSAASLGAAFANQPGVLGPPVAPDGSNIVPQAVALLNATFPSGGFLIPVPENANGTSSVSQACPFTENQFLANGDYVQSAKSTWSERFFWANNSDALNFLTSAGTGGGVVPGFPLTSVNQYRDATISNSYVFSSDLVNHVVIGYTRQVLDDNQQQATVNIPGQNGAAPLSLAGLGVTAPPNDSIRPEIGVLGGFNVGGNGNDGFDFAQNNYSFSDSLAYKFRGRHSFQFGGSLSKQQINFENFAFAGLIDFFNMADFLTGHPLLVADLQGLVDRAWRATNADAYAQDNIQISPRLTVNVGFRYERQGAIGDSLGRSSNVNTALLDPNPPAGGTLQGIVVGSNFQGALPPGVTRAPNSAAINGDGQNKFAPRVGYAWRVPGTERFVLRGGYGMYFQRSTGQLFLQLIAVPPFSDFRVVVPAAAFGFTFQDPFAPVPTLPDFTPLAYSPTTTQTPQGFSPTFQPSVIQEYSQNVQVELTNSLVLEVGYNGTRGTKLEVERAFNQANLASAADPIRGQTTNTVANIQQRVPFEGFSAPGAFQIESSGASWYNALDVSLNKRFSHGLQFLASYTWAKSLTDATNSSTGTQQGANLEGNQNDAHARYGPDGFVRPQRLVLSYLYDMPGPHDVASLRGRFLDGWAVSGVTTIQSGERLNLTFADPNNVFGIGTGALNTDPAQLAAGCAANQLVTRGSVQSKLSNYFNAACVTTPPVIGDDGIGTTFGNAGPGIVGGPDQVNFDFAFIKRTPFGSDLTRNVEFRAEFFNLFNHTQFGNPDAALNDPTFGVIDATSVAPRIIQLALKLNF